MFIILHASFPSYTSEKFASVVLPVCTWAEREGTYTSAESRVRWLNQAIKPLGKSKPNWRIITELARKFGQKNNFNYKNAFEILKEIKARVKDYANINLEVIKSGGSQFAEKKIRFKRFHVAEFKGFEEPTSKAYPYILSTARQQYAFCTNSMSLRSKTLKKLMLGPKCLISKTTAKKLNIKDNDLIRVSSRAGSIKVRAKISLVPKDLIIIPFHYKETLVNKLIPLEFSPDVEEPNLKKVAVNIKKER